MCRGRIDLASSSYPAISNFLNTKQLWESRKSFPRVDSDPSEPPGSITYLLDVTADAVDADYVVIDMSPGLGSINQNLLATSNFFIVRLAPDFFSVMAIDSLATIVPRWHQWALQAASLAVLQRAGTPFPRPESKFLGSVVQNYRPRAGVPASSFQHWIDQLGTAIRDRLVPAIADAGLLLPEEEYNEAGYRSTP